MEKNTPLWCEDCRFVSFETGLGKPILTLNDPSGFKNSTNVYSIHLELRMALPCQISTGKWKYVNPCLDFLGIPDQRTAYVKRQARPRWTYVRRSSVTPDLVMGQCETLTVSNLLASAWAMLSLIQGLRGVVVVWTPCYIANHNDSNDNHIHIHVVWILIKTSVSVFHLTISLDMFT